MERATNRKLSMVMKGYSRGVEKLQVPEHDWYHSQQKRELYQYHQGVFEAYPASDDGIFHMHHTLKVLSDDMAPV